jgi:hypothetical protein
MADSTQALAYEKALRGVTQKQELLDGIRARASTLLGIAAISASFMGGGAEQRSKAGVQAVSRCIAVTAQRVE